MKKYSTQRINHFYWMKRLDTQLRWTNDKFFPFIMPTLKSYNMDWGKTWGAIGMQYNAKTAEFYERDGLNQYWTTLEDYRADFKEMTEFMFTLGEYRESIAQAEWEKQGWTVDGDLSPTLERAKIDQILTKNGRTVYVSVKGKYVKKGNKLANLKREMKQRNPNAKYMMVAIVDEEAGKMELSRV